MKRERERECSHYAHNAPRSDAVPINKLFFTEKKKSCVRVKKKIIFIRIRRPVLYTLF